MSEETDKKFNDSIDGNGYETLWRRQVVDQLKSLQEQADELNRAREVHRIDIAVMKMKMGTWAAVIAIISSGIMSWIISIVV